MIALRCSHTIGRHLKIGPASTHLGSGSFGFSSGRVGLHSKPPHGVGPEAPGIERVCVLARGAVLNEQAQAEVTGANAASGVQAPGCVYHQRRPGRTLQSNHVGKTSLCVQLLVTISNLVARAGLPTLAPD